MDERDGSSVLRNWFPDGLRDLLVLRRLVFVLWRGVVWRIVLVVIRNGWLLLFGGDDRTHCELCLADEEYRSVCNLMSVDCKQADFFFLSVTLRCQGPRARRRRQ